MLLNEVAKDNPKNGYIAKRISQEIEVAARER